MTGRFPFRALLSRAYSSSSSPSPSSFPLKHVTRSNFESALLELRNHVRAADFVAIDLEMTGITSAPWRESFEFDRSDVRYLKVKDSAEKFAVVQFGVCSFRWDPRRLSFIAHPHNFFVFPRQELEGEDAACEFFCQTASVDFLAAFKFDFNTCIHEGISYLSRTQEKDALRRLNLQYEDEFVDGLWHPTKEGRNLPLVSITDVLFSERMKKRLSEWCDGLLKDGHGNGGNRFQGMLHDSEQQFQTIFYKMRPALCLAGFTSHQHRLIQLVAKKHFKDLAYVRVNGGNSCLERLLVYTESQSDKDLLMKEVKDEYHREAEMKIKAAIGFRHVVDILSSEKKLIVGHNCFLDIAHIYSKFFGPLPSTAEEFVSSVNKCFPYIVDTKILLNQSSVLKQRMKRSSTSLSSAFSHLCPHIALNLDQKSDFVILSSVKVEVQVDDLRSSNWSSGVKHEAGYDAFMTGCIFAQACNNLGIDLKNYQPSENLAHDERLQKHINLLYLSWTSGDIIDLRTGNKTADPLPYNNIQRRSRNILFENIVVVWGFPSKLKIKEIKNCISTVFGATSIISIHKVDESAVFVQFSKTEMVFRFLALKDYLERNNDAISILHRLSKLLEGGNTCAAGYETYVELCSASISKVLFADQAEAVGIRWKTKLVEPKEEAQTEDAVVVKSASVETCKNEVIADSSITKSSCDGVLDIFYDEVKKSRAGSL